MRIFNDIFGDHENIYDKLFDLIILIRIYEITKKGNVRPLCIAYGLCQNLEN